MHSRIYEISDHPIAREDWATESQIAVDHHIDGVDFYYVLNNEVLRCKFIEKFFTVSFPDESFRVLENKPGQTAVVEFIGDIKALYQKWIDEIKDVANKLTLEDMDTIAASDVRMACIQPFGLPNKFYMEWWNGCTVDADDFLLMLSRLARKNCYKPFKLYVGRVFDYHY